MPPSHFSGEFLIQDVHDGLPESLRGQARYVQIVECHERRIHTSPYAIEVGPDSGFETKSVLGTVPVERDGSAYFRLPAGKSVFFSVLDERYQALHTMRSVTNVQPGERTGCVGCHEGRLHVPANRPTLAAQRAPSAIEPPPWGVQPMEYATLIQPVLDKHCAGCHDPSRPESKPPDLTDRESRPFMGVPLPVSYYNLREHVRHAPMFEYSKPPGSFGSRVSPVMSLLAQGHHDVQLDPEDWRRLCAWIDCNAPGIGDYEVAGYARRDERARAAREALVTRRGTTIEERRTMLADALPAGERLVCYLDCGPVGSDGAEGGIRIREVIGTPYAYGAGADIAAPWFDDISFDAREVVYEVTGPAPDRHYKLGFSWWDHNNAGREQAVVVITDDGRKTPILGRTKLPAWSGRQEKPEERTVSLPPELSQSGTLRIAFTNETSVANAVVSEVWLIEQE